MPDPNSKPPKKIRLPMLPMRDIVVFPHMTAPFFIGRPLSIAALEEALSKDRKIFVVAQEDPLVEEPEEKNLFRMGTVGRVLQIMRLHNGTIKALFEAQSRALLCASKSAFMVPLCNRMICRTRPTVPILKRFFSSGSSTKGSSWATTKILRSFERASSNAAMDRGLPMKNGAVI